MATLLNRVSPQEGDDASKEPRDLEGEGDRKPLLDRAASTRSEAIFAERGDFARKHISVAFGGRFNPTFANNFELALRAAFFVVILGLPFLIPRHEFPTLDYYMKKGVYTNSVVIFFIYNLSKTTGETIINVICGLRGTLLAVANAWLLYLIFPGGVTDSSPEYVWWFAVVEGLAFTAMMLFLNWQVSTMIFSVSTWVFFWMAFLKPGEDNFPCPFTKDFVFLGNTGINSLITVAIGGFLCIMVTFVPYPRWAYSEAKRTGRELIHQLPLLWQIMADYYCEASPNSYDADHILSQLQRLSKLATTMDAHIANSWYECFGRRSWHHVRRILTALEKIINESYDRIFSTYSTTQANEWSALHGDIAKRIKPSLMAAAREIEALLYVCFKSAFDGILTAEEETAIKEACASVQRCEEEFTKAFAEAREAVLEHRNEHKRNQQCMEELVSDHVFALHFSSFVRTVLSFADDLVRHQADSKQFPEVQEMPTISSLWDRSVLSNPEHFNWSLRATTSILTGFVIGYFGFSDLFNRYDAGIACTVSVLLSKFVGSAMVKNLGRIQGVVLGSVMGQMVHAVFESCELWSVVALAACLYLYAVVTTFTMYDSQQYSYLGTLLAGFGCGQMLMGGCGVHTLNKLGGYDQISTTVCATGLVVFFDMLFSPGRASTFAHRSLAEAVDLIERALARHFDPNVDSVRFHKGELQDAVAHAEAMGKEAVAEPRYWRTDFRGEVFAASVQAAYQIRHSLAAMEYGMSESFQDGGRKNGAMRTILASPALGRLLGLVQGKVQAVRPLVDIFVHDTCHRFPALADPTALRSFRAEIQEAWREVASELAKHPSLTRRIQEGGTLEQDPLCQVCVVLGAVQSIMNSLRDLQHTILRSA